MMESDRLKTWFLSERRELPWRKNPTPYQVWVSEIMLQQTQVSVVIPYYERWMELFPTIEALASSKKEAVIKAWEGLGYYSRARNLHEGAKYILKHHKGKMPSNAHDLSQIKGIGPYTVGAILSFAFHQKAPAVDGNVLRVISRYYAYEKDLTKAKHVKEIQALTLKFLPEDEAWITMEGLIELGAKVCKKSTPLCGACPLQKDCLALERGLTKTLPHKPTKVKYEELHRCVLVCTDGKRVLLRREKAGKIMADLYEFPYFPSEPRFLSEKEIPVSLIKPLAIVKHTFTRFRVTLYPLLCAGEIEGEGLEWIPLDALSSLPFSSGHRQITQYLQRD